MMAIMSWQTCLKELAILRSNIAVDVVPCVHPILQSGAGQDLFGIGEFKMDKPVRDTSYLIGGIVSHFVKGFCMAVGAWAAIYLLGLPI